MKKRLALILAILTCVVFALPGCGTKKAASNGKLDLNTKSLSDITAGAKKEGKVISVGMPDSWANWGLTWQGLKADYGIDHSDTDMSSAEELNMFLTEKNSATKDIGDVGFGFTNNAISQDVVQGYKTTYWDKVPSWAKGKDGKWMIAYTGVTTFIFNNKFGTAPKSWADVRNGNYKLTIGDVVGGATGQANVLATAYAFGGSIDNLEPAFTFWKEMAKAGRIDKGDILLNRIQAGEVQCGVTWSYNALTYRDKTPNYNFTVFVPSDGSVLSGYASVINKYAPHPYSAALAREYIFSDKGQTNLAKAGAIPTRTDFKVPQSVQDATIPSSEYKNAHPITDIDKYTTVCKTISTRWQNEIIPLMK